MKKISLVTLCIINSFTFNIAMQRAQKRRLTASVENTIIIIDTFKCSRPNCHRSFELENDLAAHIKAHDECDGKIYYCDKCPLYYLRKKDLTTHSKKHIIKEENTVSNLMPDEPFILKSKPQETEPMADTEKEMRILITAQMTKTFEIMAATPPITIVTMSYKPIADTYLCNDCNIIYKERFAYFNHLFDVHKYGFYKRTCGNKKAH